MIMTVEELKGLAPSCASETDAALTLWLEGIEQTIKGETNNSFRDRMGDEYWPADVRLGVVNLRKWEDANRDKLGIASETISRHSVSYTGLSEAESKGGYPASLLKFLDPYRRARFV